MKANEFVKKYGWNKARLLLSTQGKTIESLKDEYTSSQLKEFQRYIVSDRLMNLDKLKCLVESYELVAIHSFEKSKEIVANAPSDDHFYSWVLGNSGVRDKTVNIGELRKAIADVESCQ